MGVYYAKMQYIAYVWQEVARSCTYHHRHYQSIFHLIGRLGTYCNLPLGYPQPIAVASPAGYNLLLRYVFILNAVNYIGENNN